MNMAQSLTLLVINLQANFYQKNMLIWSMSGQKVLYKKYFVRTENLKEIQISLTLSNLIH